MGLSTGTGIFMEPKQLNLVPQPLEERPVYGNYNYKIQLSTGFGLASSWRAGRGARLRLSLHSLHGK